MKISLRGGMKSAPGLTLKNHISQLPLAFNAKAAATAQIGKLTIAVGKIPVHVRIPFLKRHHPEILMGSVGGATLSVDPFSISLQDVSIAAQAIVGEKEGVTIRSDVQVQCKTAMEASGELAGKVGLGSIDLGNFFGEDHHCPHEHPESEGHHHDPDDIHHDHDHEETEQNENDIDDDESHGSSLHEHSDSKDVDRKKHSRKGSHHT